MDSENVCVTTVFLKLDVTLNLQNFNKVVFFIIILSIN